MFQIVGNDILDSSTTSLDVLQYVFRCYQKDYNKNYTKPTNSVKMDCRTGLYIVPEIPNVSASFRTKKASIQAFKNKLVS